MEPSSSSSSSPLWDVFLSFYGKDTRRNFISNLYFALDQAGILTFRDDPALEKGQDISSGLLNAIRDSKKFVVVISENYARSPWCLNELVEILSCKTTEDQVIPVFYYVDPSGLRYQKGGFGEALENHRKRQSVDMVEKWKFALAEIAKISGYHLKNDANENESDTIQEIVENVVPPTSTKVFQLEEFIVGIDSVVEEIYQKLSMNSNDVRAIGICGMGGIGKTTIAKTFYNKYFNKFDISCFIENAKQISPGGSPLLPLLKKLLTEFLKRKDYKVQDVESGIVRLKQILCSNKALIVLDDLDQSSYSELLLRLCNSFSFGSRIIITTRDVNLLNQLKVDISEVDIYMVNKLGKADSLELFCYHAFGKLVPPKSFRELTVNFATYAGGLPLALKVLGSSLRGRTDVSYWIAKLEKVRELPESNIQKILKLSYDELGDETEKAIFLDIVFFYIGKDKDEAVHVFKSCNFYPEVGIPILVERCLLTIDKNNMFKMHNLIQDMGREVIREESKHGKSRRLYLCQGNACKALQILEGTEKIEGLILNLSTWTKRHFSAKIFERLPNLRLLQISGTPDIKGNFENSFHELRCIRWHYCPWTRLPSSFCPQKLVTLDMPFSKFKTLWKGAKLLLSLKTINVSYSMNLETTPDFRDMQLVEKLLVRGCKRLLKVHSSIGKLTNLAHLDFSECCHLKELPEPIRQLTKLGHLNLRDCVNLKRLPDPITQLSNVGHLRMGGCTNLKSLPEHLGDMKGLKMLDASDTAIEQLPDSIVCLRKLVMLNLSNCQNLKKLPEQFGNMKGLITFDATLSAIEQLPDSFVGLINLASLHLAVCKNLRNLPNDIWKLKSLKVLHLDMCSNLERLPEQLGKLQCLEELCAFSTAIKDLPESIALLSRLRKLDLRECKQLKFLPNSIWNLTSLVTLSLCERYMGRINLPLTVKNMNLGSLSLSCNIRIWLPMILSFSTLRVLSISDVGQSFSLTNPLSLSKLSNLDSLTLNYHASLGFPELPLNLKDLVLRSLASLKLPDLSSLKQLVFLHIWKCNNLQSLPTLPHHLQRLFVSHCRSLQDLPDMSALKELHDLSFSLCSNLKVISLKQSSLQVGSGSFPSFSAYLPNRDIAQWFNYKSSGCSVTFDIPSTFGDTFFGVALWIVYRCKSTKPHCSNIRADITNKTKAITTKNYDTHVDTYNTMDEVQSRINCISGDIFSGESGDKITVSFQKLLYSYDGAETGGQVKVEMCGAHVIQKTTTY